MAKKRKARSAETQPHPEEPKPEPQAAQNDAVEEQIAEEKPPNDAVPAEQTENDAVEEVEEEEEEEEEEKAEDVKVEPPNDVVSVEDDGEPVEKLLEPFTKEQLTLLVKEAATKYPDFVKSVRKVADADPAHRKIFVHGLGWDATSETLINEFKKYGEIEDCKAVVDKVSGKSKGYAFILFKHRSGAKKALEEPQKKIGGRTTSSQLASAGPVPAPPPTAPPVSEYTQRKIYVSNVAAEIDPKKLTEFFSQFGEIEDGPLGLDKQTGKPRGFCLFVYKSIDSAKKALEEPHKSFEGHTLHCQKAVDGPKPNKPYFQQQQQQHQHQPFHHHSKKAKFSAGGGSAPGHLMAPSGPPMGYNAAHVPPAALAPVVGQVLSHLLTNPANILGGLGPQQGMQSGYGNQGAGGYGQPGMQGGYQNPQMGQGGGRPQGGGAHYMGHGH